MIMRHFPGQQYVASGDLNLAGRQFAPGEVVPVNELIPSKQTRDWLVRTRKLIPGEPTNEQQKGGDHGILSYDSTGLTIDFPPGDPGNDETASLAVVSGENAGAESESPFPIPLSGKRKLRRTRGARH